MHFVSIFSIIILFFSHSLHGGGGAGGRIAVYFRSNRTYSGVFESLGGDSTGDALPGGAGTVFLYHLIHKHRTLLISNAGRKALPTEHLVIKDYSEPALISGKTWLLPSSGEHNFSRNQNYYFEELQIYGAAHLAVLTEPHNRSATIYFRNMIGDRTGTIHVGYNQTMDLIRPTIDLPFNVRVYRGGFLGLAPATEVHGVEIHVDGVISYVKNLTLHHGGLLALNENSRTGNEATENDFKFDFLRVQFEGVIQMMSSPVTHNGMNLTVRVLHIEGGGKVEGSDLRIRAENISINTEGQLTVSGRGYKHDDGTGEGVHGKINRGLGSGSSSGASGGGHGGTGGRGKHTSKVGLPYGNMYEPIEFGSSGGGVNKKQGEHNLVSTMSTNSTSSLCLR